MPIFQVIDGSAIFTRVMKGCDNLKKDGLNNALSVLLQYDKAPPYNTIVVFDKETGGQGRKQRASDYKAPSDDPVKKADKKLRYRFFRDCAKLFKELGFTVATPTSNKPEADDLIAAITTTITKHHPCFVYTQDRDILQVQNDSCAVFNFEGQPLEETAPWDAKFTALYKSIVGKANETKGVKGLGKVAFQRLFDAYESDGLDELVKIAKGELPKESLIAACEEHQDDKTLQALADNYAAWRAAYFISELHPEWLLAGTGHGVTIAKAVPLPATVETRKYLEGLGVHLDKDVASRILTVTKLANESDLANIEGFLSGNYENLTAFDYESYDINNIEWHKPAHVSTIDQEITGGSWCSGENLNKVVYIPTKHKGDGNWSKNNFTKFVTERFIGHKNIAHNLAFEYTTSRNSLGIPANIFKVDDMFDTMAMASLVDHSASAGLKNQSKAVLDYEQESYDVTLEKAGAKDMSELTPEQVFQYGVDDSLVTAHLFVVQRLVLLLTGQYDLIQDTVAATVELSESYIEGTDTDWEYLEELTKESERTMAETLPLIREGLLNVAPEVDNGRALSFFNVVREDLIAVNKFKEIPREKTAVQLSNMFDQILAHTQYTEYKEEEVPVKVLPTVGFLATVMPTLGLTPPEKVSKKYLYDTYFGKGETPEQREFITAMLEATGTFKAGNRSGDKWDAFEELCLKYTTREPTIATSGFECSLASPKQKQYILYAMLGLPVRMRSKVQLNSTRANARVPGSPATDDKAIALALQVDIDPVKDIDKKDILENMLKYMKASTKLSLFFYPWLKWRHADDRMRPQFRVNHTVTRRPGGSAPNFLQLPGTGGPRNVFRCGKGRVYLSVDFANQELRIMADETEDEALMSCYIGDAQKNIHTLTATAIAEKVYRGYYPDVLRHMRTEKVERGGHVREVQEYDQFMSWYKGDAEDNLVTAANFCRSKRAKACNFTVAFGGTGHALSGNILVPLEEAEEYIEELHVMYPGIRKGQERTEKVLSKDLFVRNAFGAIYRPSRAMFRSKALRAKAGRTGFNFMMQGTAAHVLYKTFYNFNKAGLRTKYDCKIFFPIYDEIVINAPNDPVLLRELCEDVHKAMFITPPGHKIPQIAEFTLHPERLESGTELGEIGDFDVDKIKEILDAS